MVGEKDKNGQVEGIKYGEKEICWLMEDSNGKPPKIQKRGGQKEIMENERRGLCASQLK